MATDRELLEMAAKAAGHTLTWGEKYIVGDDVVDCSDMPYVVSGDPDVADWHWDPLSDDGDALRLAVKLFLWEAVRDGYQHVDSDNDFYAATRRAIVRAAAEIGRSMLSTDETR